MLAQVSSKVHHKLLDDVLKEPAFESIALLDAEFCHFLQEHCPDYFREKKFLSDMKSIAVDPFNNLKVKDVVRLHPLVDVSKSASLDSCNSFQSRILQELSDNETVLVKVNFFENTTRFDADARFVAMLLGFSVPPNLQTWDGLFKDNGECPNASMAIDTLVKPWDFFKPAKPVFPFLFQAPIRYTCMQMCRLCSAGQQDRFDDAKNRILVNLKDKYTQMLRVLLSLAFRQNLLLKTIAANEQSAVGSKLFQDAIEAALNLGDKDCTLMYAFVRARVCWCMCVCVCWCMCVCV
jgi:hypothetical protein